MRSVALHSELSSRQRQALRAVASIEFIKGVFVLLMGLCALLLVRQDVWLIAESLLALLHVNTDRHFALVFLDFADNITDARLWAAARLAFAYSALRFAEAYGLWNDRAWAEWVACISGTLLLPLEVRELLRGVRGVDLIRHNLCLFRRRALRGNPGFHSRNGTSRELRYRRAGSRLQRHFRKWDSQ